MLFGHRCLVCVRVAQTTLAIVLIMYHLGEKLDTDEYPTEFHMKAMTTTYSTMIIPTTFRFELDLFELQDMGILLNLYVNTLGTLMYFGACFFTVSATAGLYVVERNDYNIAEDNRNDYVIVKSVLAGILCVFYILDSILIFIRWVMEKRRRNSSLSDSIDM